jgi:hypothetical protein
MSTEEQAEKTKSERNEFLNQLSRFFLGSIVLDITGGSLRIDPPDKVLLEIRYIEENDLKERLNNISESLDLAR